MSLSVVKRPEGHFLNSTDFVNPISSIGTYTNGSSIISVNATDYATFSTGDFIYITNNQAVGFWYITKVAAGQINIREYSGASVYTFLGSGTFTFNFCFGTCRWNAVHLPIIYKLQSTLWPTNSVDTSRTVSSYANDNGYVKLTLSGALKSDVTELEFVKVTYPDGTSSIYQIIAWYSTSIVTINLVYIGGITFTSVQYYYNNYHARIRVYAGIQSGHIFQSQKPFALITEQKIVPDSTGIITFNINEFVKQKIDILKNDLLKGTLPNNLDAWCEFYITYAEGYDYSVGGYTLLDYVGSYSDDSGNFIGAAINADLPFKNTYSGLMNEYIGFTFYSKFLTPSIYGEITPGYYFDISFIIEIFNTSWVYLCQDLYLNGVFQRTVKNPIGTVINNWGVFRISIGQVGNEDQQIIYISDDGTHTAQRTESKTIYINNSCSEFTNYNVGYLVYPGGFDWKVFQSSSDLGVSIEGTKTVNKNIFQNWPNSFGEGADTIKQETARNSRQTITLRAENLTEDQIKDLYRIRTSPLVQIVNSANDRRTIIPEASSFVYLKQREKSFSIEFTAQFTDNLPSQAL